MTIIIVMLIIVIIIAKIFSFKDEEFFEIEK